MTFKVKIKNNFQKSEPTGHLASDILLYAFVAEMGAFFTLLSQISWPFGKRIKADFYHVLKFEHQSMFREVGTTDSNQRSVL